jgi:hypothetical protein
MRTTLTLDTDVAERLRQEMKAGKRPFKQVVNDHLRIGLGIEAAPKKKTYRVKTFHSSFVGHSEQLSMNRLADELEAEAYTSKESHKAADQ